MSIRQHRPWGEVKMDAHKKELINRLDDFLEQLKSDKALITQVTIDGDGLVRISAESLCFAGSPDCPRYPEKLSITYRK
ncbi:hypothetical protein [Serratia fonticola]